jgi:hypothetical protein
MFVINLTFFLEYHGNHFKTKYFYTSRKIDDLLILEGFVFLNINFRVYGVQCTKNSHPEYSLRPMKLI